MNPEHPRARAFLANEAAVESSKSESRK
jgi:hypothetical protein